MGQKNLDDLLTNQQHEEEKQAERTYEEKRGREGKERMSRRDKGCRHPVLSLRITGRSTKLPDQERSW